LHKIAILGLTIFIALACPTIAWAADEFPETRSLTVILVDDLSLDDINSHKGLGEIADGSYFGFVSSPTQGQPTPEKYLYSLGAGRVAGSNWLPQGAYHTDERPADSAASELYIARGGDRPPEGSIVSLDIFVMKRLAANLAGKPAPGALGTALGDADVRVRLFGNADVSDPDPDSDSVAFHREAAYFAMNSDGLVDIGDIRNPDSWASALPYLARSGLNMVQIPYLQQLRDRYSGAPVPSKGAERLAALDDTYASILSLRENTGPESIQIIMSPSPPIREGQHAGGAPIMIFLPDGSTGTIRTPGSPVSGLLRSIDIAPTIISALGHEVPKYFLGTPASLDVGPSSKNLLLAVEGAMTERMLSRMDVHELLAVVFITLIIGFTLSPLMPLRATLFSSALTTIASAMILLPTTSMILSRSLGSSGISGYVIASAVVSLVLGYIAFRFRRLAWIWIASFVLFVTIVFSDLLGGIALSFDSLWSLSPLTSTEIFQTGGLIAVIAGIGIVLIPTFLRLVKPPDFPHRPERVGSPIPRFIGSGVLVAVLALVLSYAGSDFGSAMVILVPLAILTYCWRRGGQSSHLSLIVVGGTSSLIVYLIHKVAPFESMPIAMVSVPQFPTSPVLPAILVVLLAIWWLAWRYSWPENLSVILDKVRPSLAGLALLLVSISIWLPGNPYYYVMVIGMTVSAAIIVQYRPSDSHDNSSSS